MFFEARESLTQVQTVLSLDDFRLSSSTCFDRGQTDQWSVVDAHLHPRPLGGPPVPFTELMDRLRRAGVLFAMLSGIGQRLPIDSNCSSPRDCPNTPLAASLKNDFFNAQSVLDIQDGDYQSPVVSLAMSFPDLHHPETILPNITLLQEEFPDMFRFVGKVNLVRQALWKNSQGRPVPIETIPKWTPFMDVLQEKALPLIIHCDLGDAKNGTFFLPLMDKVLDTYPKNKIIWVHMAGLSRELEPELTLLQAPVSIQAHTKLIAERLEKYPNLYIDISWDVLYEITSQDEAAKAPYVKLINQYPSRFLSGSDHLAAVTKTEAEYSRSAALEGLRSTS